jgi:hypothetical protein
MIVDFNIWRGVVKRGRVTMEGKGRGEVALGWLQMHLLWNRYGVFGRWGMAGIAGG